VLVRVMSACRRAGQKPVRGGFYRKGSRTAMRRLARADEGPRARVKITATCELEILSCCVMWRKKRTEIVVETSRLLLIGRASSSAWCGACRARGPMFTPEQAAAVAGMSVRAAYRNIEAGQLHFIERPASPLLICSASLHASMSFKER
jgi:hypothetical protein